MSLLRFSKYFSTVKHSYNHTVSFSNAVVAESALDRLACALQGKTMLPHILANVPPMLQNSKFSSHLPLFLS